MANTKCRHCGGVGYITDPVNLGKALRKLRKASDLTQAQLGDLVGCSDAHVSDIEHGNRRCTPVLERAWRKAVSR